MNLARGREILEQLQVMAAAWKSQERGLDDGTRVANNLAEVVIAHFAGEHQLESQHVPKESQRRVQVGDREARVVRARDARHGSPSFVRREVHQSSGRSPAPAADGSDRKAWSLQARREGDR